MVAIGKVIGAVCLVMAGAGAASAQQVLKAEPGPGQLQAGQSVLVDDGTCPKGQIKRVVGGANRSASGQMQGGQPGRQRSCVPRN